MTKAIPKCHKNLSNMAEIKETQPTESTSSSGSSQPSKSSSAPSRRPTNITLPPRSFGESVLSDGPASAAFGFSPGPMTLVSNLFSDSHDCKSFSQLLASAMASPAAVPANKIPSEDKSSSAAVEAGGLSSLSVVPPPTPPIFTAPPWMSPWGLHDSPGFGLFSSEAFGMTGKQAFAQVSDQAAQAHTHMHFEAECSPSLSSTPITSSSQFSSFATNLAVKQETLTSMTDSKVVMKESSDFSSDFFHSDEKSQVSFIAVDKPASDGYNWRKYGQKQVKGSKFPRSYYKCTHPNCPVKKKVEQSRDGQVTEIIYKGQHSHQPPQPNKHAKETRSLNGKPNNQENSELAYQIQSGNVNKLKERIDLESSQATPEQVCGTSDSEEIGDTDTGIEENNEDEPDAKRRSTEVRVIESASSQRTVTEPRIIVQTNSEVDLLDDGYRWRKYGQKVVKGNPYPRSYYKCTTLGCNVRKHIERAAADPKAVITTYEGKHNHDLPAARGRNHKAVTTSASQVQPYNAEKHAGTNGRNHGSSNSTFAVKRRADNMNFLG